MDEMRGNGLLFSNSFQVGGGKLNVILIRIIAIVIFTLNGKFLGFKGNTVFDCVIGWVV